MKKRILFKRLSKTLHLRPAYVKHGITIGLCESCIGICSDAIRQEYRVPHYQRIRSLYTQLRKYKKNDPRNKK